MEMGLLAGTFVMSTLSALCSVAALVVLLVIAEPKEENGRSRTPAPTDSTKVPKEDVEKRRRQAVQAKEHSNFMDYDGTPQMPIDPSTILGE